MSKNYFPNPYPGDIFHIYSSQPLLLNGTVDNRAWTVLLKQKTKQSKMIFIYI